MTDIKKKTYWWISSASFSHEASQMQQTSFLHVANQMFLTMLNSVSHKSWTDISNHNKLGPNLCILLSEMVKYWTSTSDNT